MKEITTMKLMAVLVGAGAVLAIGSALLAEDTASRPVKHYRASLNAKSIQSGDLQPPSGEGLETLKEEIRSLSKQVIAANMPLTDAQAEKFWPVCQRYVDELVKIDEPKYQLLWRYAEGNTMTDEEAESSITNWIGIDESVAQLRRKYIPIFRTVLPVTSVALFYQLDRRLQLMIDLQLTSAVAFIQR